MFVVVCRDLFSLVDELSSTYVLLRFNNLLLGLECAWDVVLLLSYLLTESMLSLYVCLFAGAVLCCISFDPCGSVRVDVGFAIVGVGGLKSGLTLNHVAPVYGCPSNVLLACVG